MQRSGQPRRLEILRLMDEYVGRPAFIKPRDDLWHPSQQSLQCSVDGVLSDDTLEAGGSTDIYFDCRRVGLSVRLQPHLTMSARTAYEMNGLW